MHPPNRTEPGGEWSDHRTAEAPMLAEIPLDDETVVTVDGADAVSLLQGQVTCDVASLAAGQVTLASLCNPKGRAIAVFRLFREDDRCHLIVRGDMAERVVNQLRRYVLRSRVSISNARARWSVFGLLGTLDDRLIVELGLPSYPPVGHGLPGSHGAWLFGLDRPHKYLLLVPCETAGGVASRGRGAPALWERAEIGDGVPLVSPATAEEFIPQMLNLDLLGAISFSKGCYTGQEVIARTRYLGTVKRRMQRYRVCCDRIPEAGARLAGDSDEHPVGRVVRAAPVDDSCFELLAVVARERLLSAAIRLWSSSGPELQRIALPQFDAELAAETSPA